jgi:HK97 family phage prohead protease
MQQTNKGPTRAAQGGAARYERSCVAAELRALETGQIRLFIPYNSETQIYWFREVIRPGFFARAIEESQDVVAWYQHGRGSVLPLGRTAAGTAELREIGQEGCECIVTPPERPWVDDLRESIRRGDIRGASFAFDIREENLKEKKGEMLLRELIDADISDFSPVVFPAYQDSAASLRDHWSAVHRMLAMPPERVRELLIEQRAAPPADPPPAATPAPPAPAPGADQQPAADLSRYREFLDSLERR